MDFSQLPHHNRGRNQSGLQFWLAWAQQQLLHLFKCCRATRTREVTLPPDGCDYYFDDALQQWISKSGEAAEEQRRVSGPPPTDKEVGFATGGAGDHDAGTRRRTRKYVNTFDYPNQTPVLAHSTNSSQTPLYGTSASSSTTTTPEILAYNSGGPVPNNYGRDNSQQQSGYTPLDQIPSSLPLASQYQPYEAAPPPSQQQPTASQGNKLHQSSVSSPQPAMYNPTQQHIRTYVHTHTNASSKQL